MAYKLNTGDKDSSIWLREIIASHSHEAIGPPHMWDSDVSGAAIPYWHPNQLIFDFPGR